jgi:hypothetical protein
MGCNKLTSLVDILPYGYSKINELSIKFNLKFSKKISYLFTGVTATTYWNFPFPFCDFKVKALV